MIESICRKIRENVQQVIVGKDEVIDQTLAAVLCEGHVLLEDVPGIGKTTKDKEEQMLAYKQFGVYSKATPSKKPNKHEK